jgi:hypothetical protein
MATKETFQQRFDALVKHRVRADEDDYVEAESWGYWSASALNLVKLAIGETSVHYLRLKALVENDEAVHHAEYQQARGIFKAAKADYEAGCYTTVERLVSGEVFGDFITAAKRALDEGNKDVAAVLASAATEDALKRWAKANGLNVAGKDMSAVIAALKSKGLIGGAQKSILETVPKIRNAAMHADWNKIGSVEVGGLIGFTQQFLIENFS